MTTVAGIICVVSDNITCLLHLQKSGKEHSGAGPQLHGPKVADLGLKTTRAETHV